MSGSWQGNWEGRILKRVQEKGFPSLTDFARAHPSATLPELVKALGPDVAVVQVESLLRESALLEGRFSEHARDLLARRLLQFLPDGWNTGAQSTYQGASAFASWFSMLGDEFEAKAKAAWDALVSMQPSPGWRPIGADDPILRTIFAEVEFPDRSANEDQHSEPSPILH